MTPGSDQARGPTITARLDDGPLRGTRIEAQIVEPVLATAGDLVRVRIPMSRLSCRPGRST